MNYLTILLVLSAALGAAEVEKHVPAPTAPLATDSPAPVSAAPVTPVETPVVQKPVLPVKPACCCEASGGRAGFLARSLTTSAPPVVTPTPVASPSP